MVVNGNLRVYGATPVDINEYVANEHGVIDVDAVAGNSDAMFRVAAQEHPETFLGPAQAAALFNVAYDYHNSHPRDAELVFTAGSAENGQPAVDENGQPVHHSHQNGANIDMRYMGPNGALIGNTAADSGDVERNQAIMNGFAGQHAGLGAVLTGNPARYGLAAIPENLRQIHRNHMHFQRNYPRAPQPQRRR